MLSDLSPSQLRAALLLSEGMEIKQVAIAIGKSRRTIERWLLNSDFQEYLKSLKSKVFERIRTEESDALVKIQLDHFQCYEVLKKMALQRLLKSDSEEMSAKEAFTWSQILDKALTGQWRVRFLGMLEINAAITQVRKAGYEVSECELWPLPDGLDATIENSLGSRR